MTGYTRNDVANNIANGNVIDATDFDGEFDALQAAFNSATGHLHDGSVGGGAAIATLGPTQEISVNTYAVQAKANNLIDLGTPALQFKNLYLDGIAQVDTLQVDESATIAANLAVTGTTTLGNTTVNTVTVTADVASNLIPYTDNTHDLGSTTKEWRNLYVDGVAQVDTLQVDESATITADLAVNGNTTLGNASTDTLTVTAQVASSVVPSVDTTVDLGASTKEWRNLYVGGVASVDSLVASTAIVDAFSANTVDISAGTATLDTLNADTVTIGAGTATLNAETIVSATGGVLTMQRDDVAVVSGEALGALNFQAPNVAGGGDATVVSAAIKAEAKATFDTNTNTTSLLFQTADSGAVATRMEIDGAGNVAVDTNTLYVDATNNRVGVLTTSPTVALDVVGSAKVSAGVTATEGASGATANSNYNNFVAEGAAAAGMSILTSATGVGGVFFGDPDNNLQGGIQYAHSTDKLDLYAVGAKKVTVDASGLTVSGSVNVSEGINTGAVNTASATARGTILNTTTDGSNIVVQGYGALADSSPVLQYFKGTSQNIRFEASGNILVSSVFSSVPTGSNVWSIQSKSDGVSNESGFFITSANATIIAARDGSSNQTIQLHSSGSSYLNGGNVGIGTSSPVSKLDVNGELSLSAATTETRALQVGQGRTGNGSSLIDLIGDATYVDYGLRIIRQSAGANAVSQIVHRGTGTLALTASDAGSIRFDTTNTSRMSIAPGGDVSITNNLSVSGDITGGNLSSGIYTPTLTAVANVSTSSTVSAQYMRVGNTVTVSGRVALSATAANTDTTIRVSLPIASDLTVSHSIGGSGASVTGGTMGNAVGISGDVTNNAAVFNLRPVNTTNTAYAFSFTYRIE